MKNRDQFFCQESKIYIVNYSLHMMKSVKLDATLIFFSASLMRGTLSERRHQQLDKDKASTLNLTALKVREGKVFFSSNYARVGAAICYYTSI